MPGMTSKGRLRIEELERENRELRKANDILRSALDHLPRGNSIRVTDDRWLRRSQERLGIESGRSVPWFSSRRPRTSARRFRGAGHGRRRWLRAWRKVTDCPAWSSLRRAARARSRALFGGCGEMIMDQPASAVSRFVDGFECVDDSLHVRRDLFVVGGVAGVSAAFGEVYQFESVVVLAAGGRVASRPFRRRRRSR